MAKKIPFFRGFDSGRVDLWIKRPMYSLIALLLVLMGMQLFQVSRMAQQRAIDIQLWQLSSQQDASIHVLSDWMTATHLKSGSGATIYDGQDFDPSFDHMVQKALVAMRNFEEAVDADDRFEGSAVKQDDIRESLAAWRQLRTKLEQSIDSKQGARGYQDLLKTVFALRDETHRLQSMIEVHGRGRLQEIIDSQRVRFLLTIIVSIAIAFFIIEPMARRVRQQNEKFLAQAEEFERLATVAQHTSNLVVITGPDRRIMWVNDAFTRLTGYTLDEVKGKKPSQVVQSDRTDAKAREAMSQALRERRGIRIELLNRAKDGREYWLDVDIQPRFDKNGDLLGFIAVQNEITKAMEERLRKEAMLNALPAGLVIQNEKGRVVECNQAAQEILGLSREQVMGQVPMDESWQLLRSDMSTMTIEEHPGINTIKTGQGLRSFTMGVMTAGEKLRWLLVNTEPTRDIFGYITGAVSCFIDITHQREQQMLLELTTEAGGVGVWDWDIKHGTMQTNEHLFRMLGYASRNDMIFNPLRSRRRDDGDDEETTLEAQTTLEEKWCELHAFPTNWVKLVHQKDLDSWTRNLEAHINGESSMCHCNLRLLKADNEWAYINVSGVIVERDSLGQPVRMAGVNIDISDQMRIQDELKKMARIDALTQLPNRSVVLERIRESLETFRTNPEKHFAVLFMDFDRFKQINDTMGHAAGDELLRQIAQRLSNTLRPGDAVARHSVEEQLAARLGGDEFVIVLRSLRSPEDAQLVASRLLKVLETPYQINDQTIHSSASIGIVDSSCASENAEDILRDADTAMYEAKRAGRGRFVVFDRSMQEVLRREMDIEKELREALRKNQLFVVYQPLVGLNSGQARSVEALVRWQHPQRGLVSPVEFIPVAEESGLIGALGAQVLEMACQQMVDWISEDPENAPESVAVNVSRAQLKRTDLVDTIARILEETGVPPHRLQLEVTESLAAQDEQVQETLKRIKWLGVSLALDDFGTGYSSLSCLNLLPVDTVKIDRAFIIDCETNVYHRSLIQATISVAKALNMRTVAEGIETENQARMLKELKCDRGQGYLYSRPLPSNEILRFMRNHGKQMEVMI